MKISIVCVGRLKEKYWTAAVDEYSKRLGKYIKLDITELPDEKAPESMNLDELRDAVKKLEKEMKNSARDLQFERAAQLRDKIVELKKLMLQ